MSKVISYEFRIWAPCPNTESVIDQRLMEDYISQLSHQIRTCLTKENRDWDIEYVRSDVAEA